jgi:hypothetical protein
MNKQTKQLIALGVLVIVGGGIAAWRLGVFGGDDAKPANTPAPINTPAAATPTPNPNAPAGPGGTTPTTPGGGAAPLAADQDLEIPEEAKITVREYTWPYPNGGKNFTPDPARQLFAAFDPLMVQNIDVVDPTRRETILAVKAEWILDGLIETLQSVPKLDESGKPMVGENQIDPVTGEVMRDSNGRPLKKKVKLIKDGKEVLDENGEVVMVDDRTPQMEVKLVLEAMFRDKLRPYKAGERLTGTQFTIQAIFQGRVYRVEGQNDFAVRSGIDLISDTGAALTIFVTEDSRYGDAATKGK